MKDKLIFIVGALLAICGFVSLIYLVNYFLDGCIWLSSQTPRDDSHWVLAIILVVVGIVLLVLNGVTNSGWLFNRWMLLGAVIGFFIGFSVDGLVNTANHRGPGFVSYGGAGDSEGRYPDTPEFSAKVSESQYKREYFVNYGIMLGIGVFAWAWVAMKIRNEIAEAKAKADYLEAQIKTSAAFHRAFVSAVDETSRERAAAEAQLSAEYQDAKKTELHMWSVHNLASKNAKGDTD
jgi:hypothetical protein